MENCKNPSCIKPPLMGDFCIEHWYTSRGKVCPTTEPLRSAQRPPVERNTVAAGRQATSRAAAAGALPKSGTNRACILDYIKKAGGATDEELELALNLSGNTVRPCRVSLVQDGWVVDSGKRRPVRSGNDAIIWCAA